MKKVVIVGAGAAGLMAGIAAAIQGASVQLIEKNNIVGKKMGITGKGRCNITNICDVETFIKNTPGNGKFLYSAYSEFNNKNLLDLLAEWGLQTKVERGGRVFPISDSAIEVRNFFMKIFKKLGGKLHLEECVKTVDKIDDTLKVVTDKSVYNADAVIIATGGLSYPVTGSTGDGHKIAENFNLKITPLLPALVPIETVETYPKEMMGLSLKNVSVTLYINNKKKNQQFGEMLFTHFGVSGPIILSMSRDIAKALATGKRDVYIDIDFKPALDVETLDARIQRDFNENKNKQLKNVLGKLLPAKSIDVMCKFADINGDKVVNQFTKEERHSLINAIKHFRLNVKGTRPIAEAIVTCGGVSVKEINPKTMESKLVKGLYFVGEVLDIDALTGGYNLQAAFSTGYVAGINASKEEIDE